MHHIDDPEEMTPDERLEEVAAILAKGYLRLKKRNRHLVGQLGDREKPPKSPEKELEALPDVSPHDT